MQIYAYLLTPPNFSYIYNNIAPFFYYIIMELLLETTKGKIAISATFPFSFPVVPFNLRPARGLVNFQFSLSH